jgi:hypothetical protein
MADEKPGSDVESPSDEGETTEAPAKSAERRASKGKKKGKGASRSSGAAATTEPEASDSAGESALKQLRDPRYERRFEPRASAGAIVAMVVMSFGAVLVGAGTYGQWLRADELGPHPWSPYLLAGGAACLLFVAFFGQRGAKFVRVGDGGVAIEREPGEIDRIAWYEVTRIVANEKTLTVQAASRSLSIPLREQKDAVAVAVAEAKARIPARLEDDLDRRFGAGDASAGERLPLDPPQIAGLRCRKSDKPITFERDARLCGRCGEVYAKDAVPRRCLTCDAKLKA